MNSNTVDAHAIRFAVNLEFRTDETVYMSEDAFQKIPDDGGEWAMKNLDSIIPDYFTQDKIEEMKKKLCEQIMQSTNPFSIYEVDLDSYPVEKSLIWK